MGGSRRVSLEKLDRSSMGNVKRVERVFLDAEIRVTTRLRVVTLKEKIRALISGDKLANQEKDLKLNLKISNLYHNGATPRESEELEKARKAQKWGSLKYRIIFGPDEAVK